MKKNIKGIINVILLLIACVNGAIFSVEWTVMFYEDRDNILERDAIDNFNAMAELGSDENINLVMLIDLFDGAENPHGNWTDARRGIINRGDIPSSGWGEDIGEVNMGDGQTLEDFINGAITNYPADKALRACHDMFDRTVGFFCKGISNEYFIPYRVYSSNYK